MAKRKRNANKLPETFLWARDATIPQTEANHNYELKTESIVKRMFASGQIRPGEIYHTNIYHDDWCGIYSGRRCNCDPDVRIITDDEYKRSRDSQI